MEILQLYLLNYFNIIKSWNSQMEYLQKEVLSRLKKTPCSQQNCGSDNQDNVELIVFNSNKAKKTGLMCSGCFVNSELLCAINPIEKYCLPVRKYLSILINFYKDYAKAKQAPEWGPSIVSKQSQQLKRKAESFYNDGLKNTLQIVQYVDGLTKKATEDLRKIHEDLDFDKLVKFIDEENSEQQERMIISNELSHMCDRIKRVEGKNKYATEQKIKKESDEIIIQYQKSVQIAVKALKELVQVHKQCLKTLL